jgi:protein-L-isoaspartate(D-aspartate) O-methyltransferase
MSSFDAMRTHMVESQILPNKVTDHRLISALSSVPRECFVPESRQGTAYIDEDLEIGPGRYLMEPMVFAKLVEAAGISESDTVLDVGCGTGYSTAILSHLAGTVIGLEGNPELAESARRSLIELGIDNAVLEQADLVRGYPDQAPYEVILVGGSVAEVPRSLLDQLADGGRLLAVVSERLRSERSHFGTAMVFTRVGDAIGSRALFDAAVPPIPGFEKEAGFVF